MNGEVSVVGNMIFISNKIYFSIKRISDILLSLVGLIVLFPLILIVKLCYVLNKDYDSIFFTQDRIGKNGKLFKLYKFRSMVPNADAILEELLKNDEEAAKEYQLNKKLKNDPRITKVGNIMRKTSLDELPQVINILLGHMSIIGNRPYLPREIKDMGKYYDSIIKTRPGLTGFWQVNGRSNTTFEERCKMESEYSDSCSLLLDIKILFKTVYVVLLGKGAE